jgi:general secretion pathway protein H
MGPLSRACAVAPESVSCRAVAGFTLLELLVVLLVLGIGAGLLATNFGGDERRGTEREAKRLAGALEHAAALAQWRGESLGVSAEGRGYRFWRRGDDDRWSALADDDVLAPRTLPAGFIVAAANFAGAPVAADAILPFRASGRNEPYALTLASPAWSVFVTGDPLNRVQVAAPAASR